MLCPICKTPVDEPTDQGQGRGGGGSTYPFCSERCKLIDLGRWLGGKYRIPIEKDNESHDGSIDSSDTIQQH
jgi:endogenous inhibitor of DNA gyrase (YacG/DUF329 family)